MQFAVHIEVALPADMPASQKDELRRRENERAIEMIRQGKLRRIWRIVGEAANIGIWQADTLEELHANVTSLPLYPYFKVKVTPLIEHPVSAAWKSQMGEFPAF